MKVAQKKQAAGARRAAARRASIVRWTIGLAVVALIGFGLSQMSNIAYDEDDIAAVDFSDLTADQKQTALESANTARCTCGCGMTLAQCVSTDMTCPVRVSNIDRIKSMVTEARRAS